MAIYNIGQVAMVNKGAWTSGTNYAALNTVTHNGGMFIAIAANTGKEPGVAADWDAFWVAAAKGIKSITIAATDSTHAQATVVFSDGTSAVSTPFSTTGVADGEVTSAKIANGAVTAVKLGSDILPINVGIKMGTAVPTASDISEGQIYLQYEA